MQCCNAGICYLLVLARLSDLQTDWQVDCSGSRGNRFSWIPWTCRIVDGFVGHTQVRWSWLFLWVLSADSSTKQILSPIITELPYTCFVCQSLLFEFSMQEISLAMSVTSGFVLRKLCSPFFAYTEKHRGSGRLPNFLKWLFPLSGGVWLRVNCSFLALTLPFQADRWPALRDQPFLEGEIKHIS